MKSALGLRRFLSAFVLSLVLPSGLDAQESTPLATDEHPDSESASPESPLTPSVAVTQIAFQGYLTNSGGVPINATVSLVLKLYDAPTGGNALWTETQSSVTATNGVFSIALGSAVPLDPADFTGSPIYLGVSVNGEAELPRTRLLASPFAIRAAEADHALTADVAADGLWTVTGPHIYRASGNVGIGVSPPSFPLDINTSNADDAFNGGLRMSREGALNTPLALGNYMKSASYRQGGTIIANHSLNLVCNQLADQFDFNIFTNTPEGQLDTAVPALTVDGATRNVGIGTASPSTALEVAGTTKTEILEITGADLVESFDTEDGADEPGTVMVIDDARPGTLKPSSVPYDRKVAGVVSGAGGVAAGIHMGRGGPLDGDTPVAMTGRVYVKCSTENGPIRPGDRLTTSATAGHAMKATDPTLWDGAVIGKAMSSLDRDAGLVVVLVNLQ